jgi:diguanylate cyclase (GGDEF)-like protein/PAS domain S-box-containing protein
VAEWKFPLRVLTESLGGALLGRAIRRAERRAELAQNRLRNAIDSLPQGVVFLDNEGRYILWNRQYAEIYHRSADLFRPGIKLEDTLRVGIARGDYPDAIGHEEEWLRNRLRLLDNPGVRHEQWLADGRCIMIEERRTADGDTIGLRVDITDLKKREESFRLLFQNNPVAMFLYDIEHQAVVATNQAAADYYGYSPEQLRGMRAEALFLSSEWDEARIALAASSVSPDRIWKQRRADGMQVETIIFSRQLVQENRLITLVSMFDVTERRRAEAKIAYMARHDELTGLANRSHFRDALEARLARGEAEDRRCAVMIIDLDHFKAVNDTLGHMVGDRLLAAAAERIRHNLPADALVARLGGDEFAVILPSWGDIGDAAAPAERIIHELAAPFPIEGHSLSIGATVGIALAPEDSEDAGTLVQHADLALYKAKNSGRGIWRRFEPGMDVAVQTRRKLEADLRRAVERGELVVYYQPLVNLESNETVGYEALLRWDHPERGLVLPSDFIPVAEEIGLIGVIGQHVLHTACHDAAQWPDDITVAVNLSPLQFRSSDVLQLTVHALAASGLAPSRLELEITEAVLMERSDEVLATMKSLRALGVGISMDDFGTGYSSLSYLRNYPFSKIKIDRSFVQDVDSRPASQAIVKAIIGLGNSLGMKVTAEGIEEPEILDYLRREGCDQGQGYLFARPVSVEELDFGTETQRRTARR